MGAINDGLCLATLLGSNKQNKRSHIYMKLNILRTTALILFLGALGGYFAALLSFPLPWMLGALVSTAFYSIFFAERLQADYQFPMLLRMSFVAIIGVMIGAQINVDLITYGSFAIYSLMGLTLFVPLAYLANYLLFRKLGGYDGPTALFCAAPGGLIESIAMGETRSADIALITTQQFMRIIIVVALVPTLISFWVGSPIGSAGGMRLSSENEFEVYHLMATLIAAGIGLAFGQKVRLPAGQMTGPLLVAGVLSLSGFVTLALPEILIICAQIVIGSSLGSRFSKISRHMLFRAFWLALLSVIVMIALASVIILALSSAQSLSFDILFISFMPGGLIEMSLIALSLGTNPALVTLHHIYRILVTVALMGILDKHWLKGNAS